MPVHRTPMAKLSLNSVFIGDETAITILGCKMLGSIILISLNHCTFSHEKLMRDPFIELQSKTRTCQ